MKLQSIIWQYGKEWKKKLELHDAACELSIDDAQKGSTMIYNHAINPSTSPSTGTDTELPYINEQTQNKAKRSKVDAIMSIWGLLDSDVTEEFLRRFNVLFSKFTMQDIPLYIYNNDEED